MRGATTCTGPPNWSRTSGPRGSPARVDGDGAVRGRDVDVALLVAAGGSGADPLLLGTWSSSEWTLSCHDRDHGFKSRRSRLLARSGIDCRALMAESWVRGSTGERSVRIREIEGSIPSVSTTRVHGSTGERSHGMREIEGSIPSGSTNS